MKKAIQLLSFSLFVSFTFPCFQMCSDAALMKRKDQEIRQLEPAVPTKAAQTEHEPLGEGKVNAEQVGLPAARAEWTFSTYELALKSFQMDSLADFKERATYPFLCFTGVLLFTVLLCYDAVRERFFGVYRKSLILIFLLLTAQSLWVYDNTLEELQQLKWGFYLVLTTLVVLTVLSNFTKRNNA